MTQRLTQRQISQLRSFDKNRRLWAKVDPKIADPDLRFFLDNNLVKWNRDEIGGYTLTDRGRIVLQNAAQQKDPKPWVS